MDIRLNNLKSFILSLLLSLMSVSVYAETGDVCKPFMEADVDDSIIATMLASAKDGHLYRIQPASSRVGFCVEGPFGAVEGEFKEFTGGLTFLNNMAVSNEHALVMLKTGSLTTDAPLIDSLLKGEKFFNADKHPEIIFVSKDFQWISETEAMLIGELTMNGKTREVGFHVELVEEPDEHADEQHIHVKATTLINRSEFGLTSMSPMVSDAVSLCMSVNAVKYQGQPELL